MSDHGMHSAEDKKYMAQADARTLAEAEVIKYDKERLEAATEATKGLAKDAKEEAEAMTDVASVMFKDMIDKED